MSENAVNPDGAGRTPPLPTIAIVGRPNVGKSSLFNAILGRRHAIVLSESGITRDRVAATGAYEGRRFNLIDTGGLAMPKGATRNVDFWNQSIAKQVDAALDDAIAVVFVVDVQTGLHPLDEEVASKLRSCGKRVILAVNKCDDMKSESGLGEFARLGFESMPVSCLHRRGVRNLLSEVLKDVPRNDAAAPDAKRLRIAVVGRPNVGKSSLVNKLLGEERVIVSDVPGTTRDAIDIEFELKLEEERVPAVLVDTAGIRKRSKVGEAVEKFSVMRAENAIRAADIVLFVVEAGQFGATSQDKTIASLIEDSGKGCVIVANKWDGCVGLKQKNVIDEFRRTLPHLAYAPLVFTCALSGLNFPQLYATVAQLRAQMAVKMSTGMVNRVLGDAVERSLPPVIGLKPFKIYYGTMLFNSPPTFALFVNDPKLCSDNYRSYLERSIRSAFEFTGFPVRLVLKERPRRAKGEKGPRAQQAAQRYRRQDDPDDFDDAPPIFDAGIMPGVQTREEPQGKREEPKRQEPQPKREKPKGNERAPHGRGKSSKDYHTQRKNANRKKGGGGGRPKRGRKR